MPTHLRALLAAVAVLLVAAPAAQAIKVNTHPSFLQVYDDNVENLPSPSDKCPARWQNLVNYMHGRSYSPDLLTIEQISGTGQARFYARYLSKRLPGTYRYLIAKSHPKAMKSPCGKQKRYQTNAIFYRTGRLYLIPKTPGRWRADRLKGGHCRNNSQDRSIAVRAQFYDKVAKKFLTIGVIHWPTGRSDGPPCARENARETAKAMSAYSSDLRIVGGDFNVDPYQGGSWYSRMTHTSHFGDMLSGSSWTFGGNRRIDMVFAKRFDNVPAKRSAAHTITFNEAGGRYSDHRAVRVRVHY